MLTLTIRDLLIWCNQPDEQPDNLWEHSVYLFRDGDFIFYVGRTEQHIMDRLANHVGRGFGSSVALQWIKDNLPAALDWQIDLFRYDECFDLVKKHCSAWPDWGQEKNWRRSSQLIERALIIEHQPALNTQWCQHSRPLPEKYTHARDERRREFERLMQKGRSL